MPPWQCGGEMIERVSFSGTTFNRLPFKFEAGTPPIADAVALAQALKYLSNLDRNAIAEHEKNLRELAIHHCQNIEGITLLAIEPKNVGILSFTVEGVHNQDLAALLDQSGIAVRSGHHCTMPLMEYLGFDGTIRASFALYNTKEEVTRFTQVLQECISQLRDSTHAQRDLTSKNGALSYCETDSHLELVEALHGAKSWQARFDLLMNAGRKLPTLPQNFVVDEHRVAGCESNVWLIAQQQPDLSWSFAIDSDAKLMRGIIYLILSAVQHQTSESIQALQTDNLLASCGLNNYLSPSRTNGVQAIIHQIKHLAK
jgi:cysteine desulfurase/selenocysteine lyase